MNATLFKPESRAKIRPYEYQDEDHDASFRLWDGGEVGTLTRAFTGAGKTIMACLKIDTWLNRSPQHHAMIISYEKELVSQFADEVYDVLGESPGIEMEKERIDHKHIPRIVVASRQSLLPGVLPTEDQLKDLKEFGVENTGAYPKIRAKSALRFLNRNGDPAVVIDEIIRFNEQPEVIGGVYSRVHKFDWRLNWLVIYDEAHRHKYSLRSIGHIVDWFEQNPDSRRCGLTATPKRSDGVSIGSRMFPGISLDYPLFSMRKPCAVKDGYAVPYVQRYISVEGVDFKQIKKVAGDFDDADLERVLGEEGTLAKLVEPLLDMVDDRQTLIFNPGVEMARNVASYINARAECVCECGKRKWYPKMLIGDGAECSCGKPITRNEITKDGNQAEAVWGEVHVKQRKEIYAGHKSKRFQFLCVCGLCREGYNDPDIACVAVFRPVSKKASSLAEQMKGRGARPLRGLLSGLTTREERLEAIANSEKPNCLIVDLVGITGLGDCASTAAIYSEGLPDEIAERAGEILQESEEPMDVEEAVRRAEQEDEDERERIRLEKELAERAARERAEKRAKADAQVTYTQHEVGSGGFQPTHISAQHWKFIEFLGMTFHGWEPDKRQAREITEMLLDRVDPQDVAAQLGLDDTEWDEVPPTAGQMKMMAWKRLPVGRAMSKRDASLIISAFKEPDKFASDFRKELSKADTPQRLTAHAESLRMVRGVLPQGLWDRLRLEGGERRHAIQDKPPEY